MSIENSNCELLYKEYERLQSVINSYSLSSLRELKLLGTLCLIFAWKPLLVYYKKIDPNNEQLLFWGFVIIAILSVLIIVQDFLKQSLIMFNFRQLEPYEKAISNQFDEEIVNIFQGSKHWYKWYVGHHSYVAKCFYLLYFLIIIFFPFIILFMCKETMVICRETMKYPVLYLFTVILLSIIPYLAWHRLYKEFDPHK